MAIAGRDGAERGLAAIAIIEAVDRMRSYPFYPAAIGELELRAGRLHAVRERFSEALRLARNDGERRFLEQRVGECERRSHSRTSTTDE
jgi:predicted RNA polymerase sigma factor